MKIKSNYKIKKKKKLSLKQSILITIASVLGGFIILVGGGLGIFALTGGFEAEIVYPTDIAFVMPEEEQNKYYPIVDKNEAVYYINSGEPVKATINTSTEDVSVKKLNLQVANSEILSVPATANIGEEFLITPKKTAAGKLIGGETTILATTEDGLYKTVCRVFIDVPVESLVIHSNKSEKIELHSSFIIDSVESSPYIALNPSVNSNLNPNQENGIQLTKTANKKIEYEIRPIRNIDGQWQEISGITENLEATYVVNPNGTVTVTASKIGKFRIYAKVFPTYEQENKTIVGESQTRRNSRMIMTYQEFEVVDVSSSRLTINGGNSLSLSMNINEEYRLYTKYFGTTLPNNSYSLYTNIVPTQLAGVDDNYLDHKLDNVYLLSSQLIYTYDSDQKIATIGNYNFKTNIEPEVITYNVNGNISDALIISPLFDLSSGSYYFDITATSEEGNLSGFNLYFKDDVINVDRISERFNVSIVINPTTTFLFNGGNDVIITKEIDEIDTNSMVNSSINLTDYELQNINSSGKIPTYNTVKHFIITKHTSENVTTEYFTKNQLNAIFGLSINSKIITLIDGYEGVYLPHPENLAINEFIEFKLFTGLFKSDINYTTSGVSQDTPYKHAINSFLIKFNIATEFILVESLGEKSINGDTGALQILENGTIDFVISVNPNIYGANTFTQLIAEKLLMEAVSLNKITTLVRYIKSNSDVVNLSSIITVTPLTSQNGGLEYAFELTASSIELLKASTENDNIGFALQVNYAQAGGAISLTDGEIKIELISTVANEISFNILGVNGHEQEVSADTIVFNSKIDEVENKIVWQTGEKVYNEIIVSNTQQTDGNNNDAYVIIGPEYAVVKSFIVESNNTDVVRVEYVAGEYRLVLVSPGNAVINVTSTANNNLRRSIKISLISDEVVFTRTDGNNKYYNDDGYEIDINGLQTGSTVFEETIKDGESVDLHNRIKAKLITDEDLNNLLVYSIKTVSIGENTQVINGNIANIDGTTIQIGTFNLDSEIWENSSTLYISGVNQQIIHILVEVIEPINGETALYRFKVVNNANLASNIKSEDRLININGNINENLALVEISKIGTRYFYENTLIKSEQDGLTKLNLLNNVSLFSGANLDIASNESSVADFMDPNTNLVDYTKVILKEAGTAIITIRLNEQIYLKYKIVIVNVDAGFVNAVNLESQSNLGYFTLKLGVIVSNGVQLNPDDTNIKLVSISNRGYKLNNLFKLNKEVLTQESFNSAKSSGDYFIFINGTYNPITETDTFNVNAQYFKKVAIAGSEPNVYSHFLTIGKTNEQYNSLENIEKQSYYKLFSGEDAMWHKILTQSEYNALTQQNKNLYTSFNSKTLTGSTLPNAHYGKIMSVYLYDISDKDTVILLSNYIIDSAQMISVTAAINDEASHRASISIIGETDLQQQKNVEQTIFVIPSTNIGYRLKSVSEIDILNNRHDITNLVKKQFVKIISPDTWNENGKPEKYKPFLYKNPKNNVVISYIEYNALNENDKNAFNVEYYAEFADTAGLDILIFETQEDKTVTYYEIMGYTINSLSNIIEFDFEVDESVETEQTISGIIIGESNSEVSSITISSGSSTSNDTILVSSEKQIVVLAEEMPGYEFLGFKTNMTKQEYNALLPNNKINYTLIDYVGGIYSVANSFGEKTIVFDKRLTHTYTSTNMKGNYIGLYIRLATINVYDLNAGTSSITINGGQNIVRVNTTVLTNIETSLDFTLYGIYTELDEVEIIENEYYEIINKQNYDSLSEDEKSIYTINKYISTIDNSIITVTEYDALTLEEQNNFTAFNYIKNQATTLGELYIIGNQFFKKENISFSSYYKHKTNLNIITTAEYNALTDLSEKLNYSKLFTFEYIVGLQSPSFMNFYVLVLGNNVNININKITEGEGGANSAYINQYTTASSSDEIEITNYDGEHRVGEQIKLSATTDGNNSFILDGWFELVSITQTQFNELQEWQKSNYIYTTDGGVSFTNIDDSTVYTDINGSGTKIYYLISADSNYIYTVRADADIIVKFTKAIQIQTIQPVNTVTINGMTQEVTRGWIEIDGVKHISNNQTYYKVGQHVTLKATPRVGYKFNGFNLNGSIIDGVESDSSGIYELSYVINSENTSFSAIFEVDETIEFNLIVDVYNEEYYKGSIASYKMQNAVEINETKGNAESIFKIIIKPVYGYKLEGFYINEENITNSFIRDNSSNNVYYFVLTNDSRVDVKYEINHEQKMTIGLTSGGSQYDEKDSANQLVEQYQIRTFGNGGDINSPLSASAETLAVININKVREGYKYLGLYEPITLNEYNNLTLEEKNNCIYLGDVELNGTNQKIKKWTNLNSTGLAVTETTKIARLVSRYSYNIFYTVHGGAGKCLDENNNSYNLIVLVEPDSSKLYNYTFNYLKDHTQIENGGSVSITMNGVEYDSAVFAKVDTTLSIKYSEKYGYKFNGVYELVTISADEFSELNNDEKNDYIYIENDKIGYINIEGYSYSVNHIYYKKISFNENLTDEVKIITENKNINYYIWFEIDQTKNTNVILCSNSEKDINFNHNVITSNVTAKIEDKLKINHIINNDDISNIYGYYYATSINKEIYDSLSASQKAEYIIVRKNTIQDKTTYSVEDASSYNSGTDIFYKLISNDYDNEFEYIVNSNHYNSTEEAIKIFAYFKPVITLGFEGEGSNAFTSLLNTTSTGVGKIFIGESVALKASDITDKIFEGFYKTENNTQVLLYSENEYTFTATEDIPAGTTVNIIAKYSEGYMVTLNAVKINPTDRVDLNFYKIIRANGKDILSTINNDNIVDTKKNVSEADTKWESIVKDENLNGASKVIKSGEEYTFEAIPNIGYIFIGWRDKDTNRFIIYGSKITISITKSYNLEAVFDRDPNYKFSISITSNDNQRCSYTGASTGYKIEQTAVLNISTVSDMKFLGWYLKVDKDKYDDIQTKILSDDETYINAKTYKQGDENNISYYIDLNSSGILGKINNVNSQSYLNKNISITFITGYARSYNILALVGSGVDIQYMNYSNSDGLVAMGPNVKITASRSYLDSNNEEKAAVLPNETVIIESGTSGFVFDGFYINILKETYDALNSTLKQSCIIVDKNNCFVSRLGDGVEWENYWNVDYYVLQKLTSDSNTVKLKIPNTNDVQTNQSNTITENEIIFNINQSNLLSNYTIIAVYKIQVQVHISHNNAGRISISAPNHTEGIVSTVNEYKTYNLFYGETVTLSATIGESNYSFNSYYINDNPYTEDGIQQFTKTQETIAISHNLLKNDNIIITGKYNSNVYIYLKNINGTNNSIIVNDGNNGYNHVTESDGFIKYYVEQTNTVKEYKFSKSMVGSERLLGWVTSSSELDIYSQEFNFTSIKNSITVDTNQIETIIYVYAVFDNDTYSSIATSEFTLKIYGDSNKANIEKYVSTKNAVVNIARNYQIGNRIYEIIGVEESAFEQLPNLLKLSLHDNMININTNIASNCLKLVQVTLPFGSTNALAITQNLSQNIGLECKPRSEGGVEPAFNNLLTEVIENDGTRTGIYTFTMNHKNVTNSYKYFIAYIGDKENIVVPACDEIYSNALYNNTVIKSVTLQAENNSDWSTIGISAFEGCSGLESINLRNVRNIGSLAFKNCTSLINVELNNCESLGASAFSGCSSLESIVLPNIRNIGSWAFHNCTALKSVELNNCERINNNVFDGCESLSQVSAPKLQVVYSNAFLNCSSLVQFNSIEDGQINLSEVLTIYNNVFSGCNRITIINAPKLTTIYESTFSGCVNIEAVYLNAINGFSYQPFVDSKNNIKVFSAANASGNLPYNFFDGFANLQTVTLPKIEKLGENTGVTAFTSLTTLKSVDLSSLSVTRITGTQYAWDTNPFYNSANNLTNLVLGFEELPRNFFFPNMEVTGVFWGGFFFGYDINDINRGNIRFYITGIRNESIFNKLQSISLPNCTKIDQLALAKLISLNNIEMPKIETLDVTAFYGTRSNHKTLFDYRKQDGGEYWEHISKPFGIPREILDNYYLKDLYEIYDIYSNYEYKFYSNNYIYKVKG